jgi:hypothetical protein
MTEDEKIITPLRTMIAVIVFVVGSVVERRTRSLRPFAHPSRSVKNRNAAIGVVAAVLRGADRCIRR